MRFVIKHEIKGKLVFISFRADELAPGRYEGILSE